MDSRIWIAAVALWFGFSLLVLLHFLIRASSRLKTSSFGRLLGLGIMLIGLVGVFAYALFAGYVERTLGASDVATQGLLLGAALYVGFAWLYRRVLNGASSA